MLNISFLPQLLHMSLKRSKVNSSDDHVLEMLDPFVELLINCLQSTDVKVGDNGGCLYGCQGGRCVHAHVCVYMHHSLKIKRESSTLSWYVSKQI